MIIKPRKKSINHLVLELLHYRAVFSFQEQSQFENQVKGYEGEQRFDVFLDRLGQKGFVVNDLFLSSQNTHYQFDAIVVINEQIIIYEVKNYAGRYSYEDGVLLSDTGYSIQDPVGQVNRKKSYLHNFMRKNGYASIIQAYVVYINPDFYLYNLPPMDSITFLGQLERHFDDLAKTAHRVSLPNQKIAQTLVQHHNENYRPDNLPIYEFKNLKKGVLCKKCFSFDGENRRQSRICNTCGYKEKTTDAIYRSVLEFQVLFPDNPVTMSAIHEWCKGVYSQRQIRYLLNSKMKRCFKGPFTYYK